MKAELEANGRRNGLLSLASLEGTKKATQKYIDYPILKSTRPVQIGYFERPFM